MKKTTLLLLTVLCISTFGFAQDNHQQTELHIIPEPVSINLQKGFKIAEACFSLKAPNPISSGKKLDASRKGILFKGHR